MKAIIKKAAFALSPRIYLAISSARGRAISHRAVKKWGCLQINEQLIERCGDLVQSGHFAGMKLTSMTFAEQIGPYLLGLYESELDQVWTKILARNYSQIIDIGSKFGYYAVGLARRYQNTPVIAFDTDWWARAATKEMSEANKTNNVRVKSFCSPNWLADHAKSGALVVCDIDGGETLLLQSEVLARLNSSTLVIETHDCFVPGITQELRSAYELTHWVEEIDTSAPRRASSLDLSFLPSDAARKLATDEVRPPQSWLVCTPKQSPNVM